MSFAVRAPPPPGGLIPSITATLLATATAAAAAAEPPTGSPEDDDSGECRLLGPFAILIQSALGALALLSLVYKRYRERPQRPIKIWAFDVSKQVVGSILLHLLNLAMSELSSGAFSVVAAAAKGAQGAADLAAVSDAANTATSEISGGTSTTGSQKDGVAMGVRFLIRSIATARSILPRDGDDAAAARVPSGANNPCSFYLLNLAIDTTVGIPILIVLLRLATAGFARTPLARPPESIKTGNYGQPPRTTWWLKQCLIYFIGLLGMKFCVFLIFQMLPWLGAVGDWALRWTEGDERLQIFFVMLFFPLVMNALQYYIIDGFIKEQKPKDAASYEEVGQHEEEEEEDTLVDDGIGESSRLGDSDDEEDNDVAKKKRTQHLISANAAEHSK